MLAHDYLQNRASFIAPFGFSASSATIMECIHIFSEQVLIQGKFVLFNGASRTHCFSYHQLLDVNCMVRVTYLFTGNLLLPHRLPFTISSKRSFICTFPAPTTTFEAPVADHWLERKIAQTANASALQIRSGVQVGSKSLHKYNKPISFFLPSSLLGC